MLTGYRITSAKRWRMNLLRLARIITTKTTTKMKTTNDDCVGKRVTHKRFDEGKHMKAIKDTYSYIKEQHQFSE
jgi:hypothetical protein